jgi:hypothetical protein
MGKCPFSLFKVFRETFYINSVAIKIMKWKIIMKALVDKGQLFSIIVAPHDARYHSPTHVYMPNDRML